MAKKELDVGELYKGPCGVLKDSNWLTAETLPTDRDTVVQIEAVIRRGSVKFANETKSGYGSLRFVGKEKELGLNATNLRTLSALFGPNTSAWFGQWIALYVDPEVEAFGKTVSAVRIRAKKTAPPKKGETKPEPVPEEAGDGPPTWMVEQERLEREQRGKGAP